jgi:hypothetical protein
MCSASSARDVIIVSRKPCVTFCGLFWLCLTDKWVYVGLRGNGGVAFYTLSECMWVWVLSCVFLVVALQYMYLTSRIAREWMLKHSRLLKTNIALLQSSHITSFFHSLAERDLDHFEHGGTPITHHSAAPGQMGTPLANVAAAFFAAPFVFASCRSRQAFQTWRPFETRVFPPTLSCTSPAAAALESRKYPDDPNMCTPRGLRPLSLPSLLLKADQSPVF